MAAVYEVIDGASQRRLALKQFRPTAASDARRARVLFEREFHTLSQLSHPCIVAAFDYGDDPEGPYYTMELIEGQDLRALAPMPWRQACSVLRDVASALAAVHARRLIHRDISYRNARLPPQGRTKLLDFGALATFGAASDVAGIAPFVSPDALRGQRLDARSDLYSLGCLAYYLLTGKLAFDAQRNDELEALWLQGAPPPSTLAASVPEPLDALVAGLMRLDPFARPQSAADVIAQLSALADLPDEDARDTARAYLASPRLCARDREIERVRKSISQAFHQPVALPEAPAGDEATGRFRVQRVADSARSTLDLTGGSGSGPRKKPNVVVIAGAAGMGRSRMLQELVVEAKLAGARTLHVSAAAIRRAPYEVAARLVDALRVQRPDLLTGLPAESRLLVEGLRAGPEPTANEAIGQPIAIQQQRLKTANALAALFEAAGAETGLLIAVDDAHACDEATASALMAIAGRTSGSAILLAITRDTEARAHAGSVIDWLQARAVRVELQALDAQAVAQLADSLFGQSEHVRALSEWLFRVSAGNPFVCIELLEHLIDEGTIRYDGGGWLLPKDPAAQGLPESLTAMQKARIERLSPRARGVAELLSLFDEPLPIDQCIELAEGPSGHGVFEAVDELILHGLVVGDGTTQRLAHEPLREALRSGMDEHRRTALHRRIGEMLLEQWPRTNAETLETAYHLIEGGDPDRAAAVLGKLGRVNPFFALHAGPRAARVLERALEGAPGLSDARRLSLQIPLLVQRADLDSGDAALGDAVIGQLSRDAGFDRFAELREPADPRLRVRRVIAERQQAFDASPRHERGLPPLEASLKLPACVMNVARMHTLAFDIPAVQRLVPVVEPYRYISELGVTVYDSIVVLVESMQGRSVHAKARYARMLRTLETPVPGAPFDPAVLHLWRCEVIAGLGICYAQDYRRALEYAQLLETSGFEAHRFEVGLIRMLVHLLRGEQGRGEAVAEGLEEQLVQHRGGWHHLGLFTVVKARAYARLGDTLALKQCLSRLDELQPTFPCYAVLERTARGHYLYHVGDCEAALAIFEGVLGDVEAGAHEVWSTAARGRTLALVGLERHAEALAAMQHDLARAHAAGVGDDELELQLAPVLQLCRAETGEVDSAAAVLDAHLATLKEAGPLLLAEAHCARARIAELQNRRDLARSSTKAAERAVRRSESRALLAWYERGLERTRRGRRTPVS
jgi:tRNA A-37 threonylcarbamoyl transferase component Bud32